MNTPPDSVHHPISDTATEASFAARVKTETGMPLGAHSLDTVQVNISLVCNLACHHCHVESSPARTEEMSKETLDCVLRVAARCGAKTIDITGGAPEMHPHFREFVAEARALDLHVIVRSNLTILLHPRYTDMPELFAELGLHVMASLPCYLEENVTKQRGRHVYGDSIEAIRRLNALGYGEDERLQLDLIYNPGGPTLPPEQHALERDYRRELDARFGICFNRLFVITNMPIGRFQEDLRKAGRFRAYDELLRESFNRATVDGLMCRYQIHVGWDGTLHDCDFNFALGMKARGGATRIEDFEPTAFLQRPIATGPHCFGCTAGSVRRAKAHLLESNRGGLPLPPTARAHVPRTHAGNDKDSSHPFSGARGCGPRLRRVATTVH